MSDWNEIKRPFREALIAAYNWKRLSAVVTYHGNHRLDLITSENAGFAKNVDDVIADAEQNGWLEDLAQGALAENQKHIGLQATVPLILQGVAAEGKVYYQHFSGAGADPGRAGDGMQIGDRITTDDFTNAAGVAVGPHAQSQVFQGDVHYHYEMPAASPQAVAQALPGLDPNLLLSLLRIAGQKPEQRLPKMEDIFEIIHDPEQVISAVFRIDPGQGLTSYEVDYVSRREGQDNVQQALMAALLDAGGILLLQSRAGLGKTREIAELAKYLCRQHGWTICVARGGEADKALNRLANYPNNLQGKRLLLVLDDLHRRASAVDEDQEPYAERLAALLDYLAEQMKPGSLRVLATARSEPHHQKQLGFDQDQEPWQRFGLYELPEFTTAGLEHILIGLAERTDVPVDSDDVGQMVKNCDRTLRTLLDNVNFARRNNQPLTVDNWLPTQGESWDMRYREARGLYPGVQAVYESIHLIREAGLVTRSPYVAYLSSQLTGADTRSAVDGLFDMGLLGIRGGILDAFSDEQLVDSLQKTGGALPQMSGNWDRVIETITKVPEQPDGWLSDLVTLTERLNSVKQYEQSIAVAGIAVGQGADGADLYYNRGLARSETGDYSGAGKDFTAAIERNQDDTAVYISRAGTRFFTADFAGVEADLTVAIERGDVPAMVFSGRGAARVFNADYDGAEADLATAVMLGQDDAEIYLVRGISRFYRADYDGAEKDLTTAVERGQDGVEVYLVRAVAQFYNANHEGAEADLATAIERGHGESMAFFLRGAVRHDKADYDGAEADLTNAIERGQDDAWVFFLRGASRHNKNDYAEAEADFTAAIERGRDDVDVYLLRGDARFNSADFAGAEADYSAAIKRGWDEASVYFYRGRARFETADHAGAEEDYSATIERGRDDVEVYLRRGDARFNSADFAGAEEDYAAAIERGRDDALVYSYRGRARYETGNHAGAEEDYTAAIERGQDDAGDYLRRGDARYYSDDAAGAESDYTAAIERGWDEAPVYYFRGRARAASGDHAGAVADYNAAIERGLDDGEVYYRRGIARDKNSNPLGAEEDLTIAIERGLDSADTYLERGLVRYFNAGYDGAEADLTTAIERGDDRGNTYYFRALSRYFISDYAGAAADFTAAIERGADDADIRSYLGLVLRLQERWLAAAESYRHAVELDPSRHLDWIGLAASARMAGDDALWQESIEQARPLVDWDDHYNAACFTSVAGEIDHALDLLRRALQAQPELLDQTQNDPDLHWVREDPRFAQLIEEAGSG